MTPADLFSDNTLAFLCALAAASALFARVGYLFGFQAGFKTGVKRGLRFSEMKILEADKENFINGPWRN
jgi:hypothetical protein